MSIRSFIASLPVLGPIARRAVYTVSTLSKIGGIHPRECPICGFQGRFAAHGDPPRWDARCPACNSLERHRLFALFLKDRPDLVQGRTIHFAPDPGIKQLVAPLAQQYQTADLFRSGCDLKLNIEEMDLKDQSVDTFIVSHVLEHVDDRKALPELFRCLRPGGRSVIMVPVIESWEESYENSKVATDSERHLHYGHTGHRRFYGSDVRKRIRSAGFDLAEYVGTGDLAARFGLWRGEAVFIATKPARSERRS